MERKKLLGSQRKLLFIMKADVDRADKILRDTLISIADELGIPKAEMDHWILNEEAEYFEKKNQR